MHPLSFLLKRGHLSAVARGREMFAGVKHMTPARFDLMYLIHESGPRIRGELSAGPMAQVEVQRQLGLARQTVWKMVKRLVELGLLTSSRDSGYRRLSILQLTEEGVRRIRQAFGVAFTESYPLPLDAPADGDVPRHFKRIARDRAKMADEVAAMYASSGLPYADDLATSSAPAKIGREVAKIFTSFAWDRGYGGRRGRRWRHLEELDRMIEDAKDMAQALGDTSELIYQLDYESDH